MPLQLQPRQIAKMTDAGYKRLKWAREAGAKATRAYVGRHYGENPDEVQQAQQNVANLIQQSVTILIPNLVAQNNKHRVTSPLIQLQGEARKVEIALNQMDRQLGLADIFERCTTSAILKGPGIVKIGIRAGPDVVKVEERYVNKGQVYVSDIDLDDYVLDAACRKREEAVIEGHRYRIPKAVALASGIFDNEELAKVPTLDKLAGNRDGKRAEAIGGNQGDRFDDRDLIELWDIAVYQDDSTYIVTLAAGDTSDAGAMLGNSPIVLMEPYEFNGPERGPYEMLGFGHVPNNPMPFVPVDAWRDLHVAMAKVANKMVRQLLRTKKVMTYEPSAADDALVLLTASDGESVGVKNPDGVKMQDMGGVPPELYEGVGWMMGQFNNASGNLQMVGGQRDIGKTATAASIMQGNSSVRIQWMQAKCRNFAKRIDEQVGHLLVTDPLIHLPMIDRLDNGMQAEVVYSAQTRKGKPTDFEYDVEPFNPASMDPEARAARLVQLFQSLPAFAPLIQAGIPLDKILSVLGREMGVDGLDELVPTPGMVMQNMQDYGVLPEGGPGMQQGPGGPVAPQQMQNGVKQGEPTRTRQMRANRAR